MSTNNQNKPTSPWASVPINTGSFMMPFFPGFNYNPTGCPPEESSEIKDDRDGCICNKCREFYAYAEPNQEDKKTFICYSCRHGY